MEIEKILLILTEVKALNETEYSLLYNILIFIGVIVIILVMIYVLIGKEPEEEI